MLRPTIAVAALCLIGACAPIEVHEPPREPARQPDPEAGQLTLPGGERLWVHPDALEISGQARYRWPDGKTYQGQWAAGQPHGVGTMTHPSGDRYSGTWQSGQRHGHGELTDADGSHYVGEFVSGLRSGEGAQRSARGLYRGAWAQDLPSGYGEFFATDGSVYRGQWGQGVRQGTGTYTDAQGSRYQGDWLADQPHGFGHLASADGTDYEGRWVAGKRDGYGRASELSGLRYEGTWIADVRQGYGRMSRPDGSSYLGEWLAGKRHGKGRENSSTGADHQGTWENDLPRGPGTRTDSSGISISGAWENSQVSAGLLSLPTGPEYAGPLFSSNQTRASTALQTWLIQVAAQGDPYAALVLGRLFSDFNEPAPDPARAAGYFDQAAAAGLAEAQYRLALSFEQSRPPRAIELLVLAADADHPRANAALGRWYLRGEIVPADADIALRYLQRGTDLGDIQARNDLAWLLATNRELLDPPRAVALIEPIATFLGDWQYLATLAAAHAASGEFVRAALAQTTAIDHAQADSKTKPSTLQQMQQRLERYRRNEATMEIKP